MFRFSLYIAFRYFLLTKRVHATNAIAWIAMAGVIVCTVALVCVVSVFNGIEQLINAMYSSWNTDLKIIPTYGKVIHVDSSLSSVLSALPIGTKCGKLLEEDVLLEYRDRQYFGHVLGIDSVYAAIVQLANHSVEGYADLFRGREPLVILSRGVAFYLGASPSLFQPLTVYVPKRKLLSRGIRNEFFYSKSYSFDAVIGVNSEFDERNIILPIEEVQSLLEYDDLIASSIMISLPDPALILDIQTLLQNTLGDSYSVLNRLAQNELLYKTIRGERIIIFIILYVVFIICMLNLVGFISILTISKQTDIYIYHCMGAKYIQLFSIFAFEGLLITIIGAGLGLIIGSSLCLLQKYCDIIVLRGSGSFIVQTYPVDLQITDLINIVLVEFLIGFLTSIIPLGSLRLDKFPSRMTT